MVGVEGRGERKRERERGVVREEEVERKRGSRLKKKKNNHLSDPRHRLKDQVFHESGGLVRRALRLGERHEPQRERREVRRQAVPDHS